MAKAPASDSIMPPDKMKPLLALSKREPVQAAIGLTSDGEALILFDKRAKPKKVLSMLRTSAGKAKLQLNGASLRFGRAEVDTDYDSSMVRFFVNKETPGNMRVKLVEVVKRIPYQKVEINVDPSLEEDSEEEETQEAAAPTSGEAQPGQPTQDPAAAAAELGGLARRIPEIAGTDTALKARLLKLATDANAAIKAGNPADSSNLIAQLRAQLAAPAQGATTTAPAFSPVAYAKSRLAWIGTRQRIESELQQLRVALTNEYKDGDDGADIVSAFDAKISPVLAALDIRLADKLDDATNAADAATRSKLVAEAKQLIAEYQAYLAGEPLIKDLDENPFAATSIQKTVGGTLTALAAALR